MKKSPVASRQSPDKGLPPDAFDRVPRVQLTFTDETVWLTRFDSRGFATATYPVALGDVARTFYVVGASTSLIGENTLFIQNVRGVQRIGLWLPPGKRALSFAGRCEQTLTVPLPGFVFIGQGTHYWIFAATERPRASDASLYRAPLPNVHSGGSICAGNVKFPKARVETLPQAATLFFESQFNHDLAQDKIAGREENLIAFLRKLQGAKTFPLKRLVRAGVTMQDVMEGESNENS